MDIDKQILQQGIIKFSPNFTQNTQETLFCEVDQEILNQLKNNKQLRINGFNENQNAVLITSDKIYKIKQNIFSNEQYQAKTLQNKFDPDYLSFELLSQKNYILDFQNFQPDYSNLFQRLKENQIIDLDFKSSDLNINFDLKEFQISEQQYQKFIQQIGALQINDNFFLVQDTVKIELFHIIRQYLFQNTQQSYDIELLYQQSFQVINIINKNINKDLFFFIFKQIMDFDNDLYQINYSKMKLFIIKEIFLEKNKYFYYDFVEIFERMLKNYQIQIDNNLNVQNEFIINDENNYQDKFQQQKIVIKQIIIHEMPFDFKERLKYLFSLKNRYFYQEIKQLSIILLNDQKKFDEEIAKNTRVITQRITKINRKYFEKLYQNYLDEIKEDIYYEGGILVKFYVNKF